MVGDSSQLFIASSVLPFRSTEQQAKMTSMPPSLVEYLIWVFYFRDNVTAEIFSTSQRIWRFSQSIPTW